jgi:hypothetical protein
MFVLSCFTDGNQPIPRSVAAHPVDAKHVSLVAVMSLIK